MYIYIDMYLYMYCIYCILGMNHIPPCFVLQPLSLPRNSASQSRLKLSFSRVSRGLEDRELGVHVAHGRHIPLMHIMYIYIRFLGFQVIEYIFISIYNHIHHITYISKHVHIYIYMCIAVYYIIYLIIDTYTNIFIYVFILYYYVLNSLEYLTDYIPYSRGASIPSLVVAMVASPPALRVRRIAPEQASFQAPARTLLTLTQHAYCME